MQSSAVFHKKRDYHRWTENPFLVLWQVPRILMHIGTRHSV